MEPSSAFGAQYRGPLAVAARAAEDWLDGVAERPIAPSAGIEDVKDALGRALPDAGEDSVAVVESLAAAVVPGLMAMQSPRFHGWVIGGTSPASLAADWLVSAWDQNAVLREPTPGVVAVEELAGEWLCDLLGLPGGTAAGFTTGATTANTVALAAARHDVLARAGWDDVRDGIQGAPRVRVIAGAEHHPSVAVALRVLGLGLPEVIACDEEGRILPGALADALEGHGGGRRTGHDGPVIVCLQAGNVHSGASDPFAEAIPIARDAGAWVHVDGAFGLWAAASPRLRHLVAGVEAADSWATDAHKTLNVPYDAGIVAVADADPLVSAVSVHADYLPVAGEGIDPSDRVVELSRRARGVPVYAALRELGRAGVAALVDGLAANAVRLADGLRATPGAEVLNEVTYTQVCAAFEGREAVALARLLDADGVAFAHASRWRDREVLRFSMSNRATDASAVDETLEAVRRALAG
ncbi:pyridoxal-dependent decarboxylase [Agromyces sp. LHK192]|uniref:pyridoxal phosphate-dependent decarboxylase family protein n=1 Tax=Agromyces sp. LHK192 TaxID=2498704 RepID=UPI000FD7E28B|nr:pyridoxal-dependent decarboxylase [Agromyces sp. LHK192]